VIWPLIILPNPAIVVYVHPLTYLLPKHWHKDVEEDYTVRGLCALKEVTVMEGREIDLARDEVVKLPIEAKSGIS
jgi:hypothetical protein